MASILLSPIPVLKLPVIAQPHLNNVPWGHVLFHNLCDITRYTPGSSGIYFHFAPSYFTPLHLYLFITLQLACLLLNLQIK